MNMGFVAGLLNLRFDDELYCSNSNLSYKFLWAGYDTENNFSPNNSRKNRVYIYFTKYVEKRINAISIYKKM